MTSGEKNPSSLKSFETYLTRFTCQVKRARIREIEGELVNAASLESHFSANPQDLKALKHDRALAPARVQVSTVT